MSPASAVTFGRYQAIAAGHVDTITTILRTRPRTVIGVLDLDAELPTPHLDEDDYLADFYRLCDANCAEHKNPLTLTERVCVWRSVLSSTDWGGRVELAVFPRPELAPDLFNSLYPERDFDLVFPESASPPRFEHQRHAAFGRILRRAVYSVHPDVEVHSSHIKRLAAAGHDWQHLMAPGAVEALTVLNRLDAIEGA